MINKPFFIISFSLLFFGSCEGDIKDQDENFESLNTQKQKLYNNLKGTTPLGELENTVEDSEFIKFMDTAHWQAIDTEHGYIPPNKPSTHSTQLTQLTHLTQSTK